MPVSFGAQLPPPTDEKVHLQAEKMFRRRHARRLDFERRSAAKAQKLSPEFEAVGRFKVCCIAAARKDEAHRGDGANDATKRRGADCGRQSTAPAAATVGAAAAAAAVGHVNCGRHFRQSALCARLVGAAAANATRAEPRVAEHHRSANAAAVACLDDAIVCHRHVVADYERATVSGDDAKGEIFEQTSVVTHKSNVCSHSSIRSARSLRLSLFPPPTSARRHSRCRTVSTPLLPSPRHRRNINSRRRQSSCKVAASNTRLRRRIDAAAAAATITTPPRRRPIRRPPPLATSTYNSARALRSLWRR